ncbi:MAG: hypothetical protein AAFP67_06190 [Pseudomonadota bacterium]
MPLQNRVLPTGEIVAAAWRGHVMGNRGCLHRTDLTLGPARWRHANWVACRLAFRGRKRAPMPLPGSPTVYTALFFWDEAAAFAAGHRPCAECRNADWRRFRKAWTQAGLRGASATEIDRVLQRARLSDGRGPRPHRRHEAVASSLPDGAFVLHEGQPAMIRGDRLLPWLSSGGYGEALPRPEGRVTVLTPQPILAAIMAGYAPVMDAPLPEEAR